MPQTEDSGRFPTEGAHLRWSIDFEASGTKRFEEQPENKQQLSKCFTGYMIAHSPYMIEQNIKIVIVMEVTSFPIPKACV